MKKVSQALSCREEFDSFDLTYQHNWSWANDQTLVWGLGYRHVDHETIGGVARFITPAQGEDNNASFFLHNETQFAQGAVALSYGLRAEDNERGGFEVQPNARVSWRVDEHVVFWGSVARAVRTPSISENGIVVSGFPIPPATLPPLPVPVVGVIEGAGDLDSEILDAIDIGLRWHASEVLSVDIAAFSYEYEDIILVEFADLRCVSGASFLADPACIATSPILAAVNRTANSGTAKSHGAEVTVNWQAAENLSFALHHSYLDLEIDGTDPASEFFADQIGGPNPEHQTSVSWRFEPWQNWSFDGQVRFVDELQNPRIDSYTVVDVRLAWRPRPQWQLALVGRDTGDSDHLEFVDNFDGAVPSPVESTILFQINFSL